MLRTSFEPTCRATTAFPNSQIPHLSAKILLLADRLDVLGLPVFTGSKQRVLIAVGDRVAEGVSTHIVTLNSEMVVNVRKDPHFHRVLAGADIVVSDGIGVVWAAWILRRKALSRVPGIELAEGILRVAELAGHTVYLLGARSLIIETARERIKARYPRLRVVGSHHGYFQGQEEEVIQDIVTSGAKILLVGMGSPGQEYFIARTRARLPCMVMMGIGGSYDIWAGSRRRAARWVQSLGLEWLYRAMVDLRRWRRLGFIPSFFWLVLNAKFARRQAI